MSHVCLRLFFSQQAKKRMRSTRSADEALEASSDSDADLSRWPAWVVCHNSYNLWKGGKEPPLAMQLSAAAACQVRAVRAWAAGEQASIEKAAARPSPPVVTVTARDFQPAVSPQAPTVLPFDPIVVARVASIKKAAAFPSPVTVLQPL